MTDCERSVLELNLEGKKYKLMRSVLRQIFTVLMILRNKSRTYLFCVKNVLLRCKNLKFLSRKRN